MVLLQGYLVEETAISCFNDIMMCYFGLIPKFVLQQNCVCLMVNKLLDFRCQIRVRTIEIPSTGHCIWLHTLPHFACISFSVTLLQLFRECVGYSMETAQITQTLSEAHILLLLYMGKFTPACTASVQRCMHTKHRRMHRVCIEVVHIILDAAQ